MLKNGTKYKNTSIKSKSVIAILYNKIIANAQNNVL